MDDGSKRMSGKGGMERKNAGGTNDMRSTNIRNIRRKDLEVQFSRFVSFLLLMSVHSSVDVPSHSFLSLLLSHGKEDPKIQLCYYFPSHHPFILFFRFSLALILLHLLFSSSPVMRTSAEATRQSIGCFPVSSGITRQKILFHFLHIISLFC